MSFNLAAMLTESAAADPDQILLLTEGSALTYGEIDAASGRFAAGLRSLGLAPGEAVGLQLPNCPEFVVAYFGCLKAGVVLVPINPLLTRREIAYYLGDSGARLLITAGATATAASGTADGGGPPTYVVGDAVPDGAHRFDELLTAEGDESVHVGSADDTIVLLYTSGTTGRPKGAELTAFQLYMNCSIAGQLFGMSSYDVVVSALPLFHVFGLSSVLDSVVRFGATLAALPRFEASGVVDAIEQHRATVFMGVPTMYVGLLAEDLEGRRLDSLRCCCSGGASMPGEVIREFERRVPSATILEGYGLSETASTATFNISADQRRVLSVGKPIWGVEIRVVDEAGTALPAGERHVGEVLVRGHNVMKGYFGRPEDTAIALRDGWLHTGDLGYRDSDGYLFIVDRLKDLIVRGGYNVYPREVEEVLYAHPAVAEAAVIGRPDARLGEEVVAYVALRAGATATPELLQEHCRNDMAPYKYPREIHLVDSLPKGATGKILKRELRAHAPV